MTTDQYTDLVARAKALAFALDLSPDDLGGDIGTMSLRNPDGPELFAIVEAIGDDVERLVFHEAIKRGVDQDVADQVAQAVAAAIPSDVERGLVRLLVDVRNDLYLNAANKTKPVLDKIDAALSDKQLVGLG
jgi:hypothetical protein